MHDMFIPGRLNIPHRWDDPHRRQRGVLACLTWRETLYETHTVNNLGFILTPSFEFRSVRASAGNSDKGWSYRTEGRLQLCSSPNSPPSPTSSRASTARDQAAFASRLARDHGHSRWIAERSALRSMVEGLSSEMSPLAAPLPHSFR
jgi:hypothetical protein